MELDSAKFVMEKVLLNNIFLDIKPYTKVVIYLYTAWKRRIYKAAPTLIYVKKSSGYLFTPGLSNSKELGLNIEKIYLTHIFSDYSDQ